ncbi:Uncharacterized protein APZ42_033789 [Daphnia magna]|uniref:Uncharacterized protein n=1 Tax=Daphnia magna TaxID=35525 RepID=A0A164KW84_9CRUS|nr:Uncharacterized protein APZ42_033789 [Daphnia magna]
MTISLMKFNLALEALTSRTFRFWKSNEQFPLAIYSKNAADAGQIRAAKKFQIHIEDNFLIQADVASGNKGGSVVKNNNKKCCT